MRRRLPRCDARGALGAALLLAFAGCGDAPKRPPQATPVAAPPPAPVAKPCVPWDEAGCQDGCKHGSSGDCLRLWQFYTRHARGAAWPWDPDQTADPEVVARADQAWRRALELEVTACEAGHTRACAMALERSPGPWRPSYPDVPTPIRDRVVARASARCDAGDADACELFLLRASHLSGEEVTARATALLELHKKACAAGDAEACSRAADLLDGDRDAWKLLAWQRPPSAEGEATELCRRACVAGDPRGCKMLAARLARSRASIPRVDLVPPGAAAEAAERAASLYEAQCRREREGACATLADLLPDRRAYEVLRPICDAGSRDACDAAVGRFLFADGTGEKYPDLSAFSPAEAQRMTAQLRRDALELCKRGDSFRCEQTSPRWFAKESVEEREVARIAASFCQIYDRPGVVCHEAMGELCLGYCDPSKGMLLPGVRATR